jgi:SAM-dependent methyltransferase
MDDWAAIWERKGLLKTTDLKQLDGYEDTGINFFTVAQGIKDALLINAFDSVLEVGCGAGALYPYFKDCKYIGVDRSKTMRNKFLEIHGEKKVFCYDANSLPFDDKSFDFVIMYSVAQYFPDHKYFNLVVKKLERIAKRGIFIGDLPERSHRDSHLLFSRDFQGVWNISDGFYNKDRFNIYKRLT